MKNSLCFCIVLFFALVPCLAQNEIYLTFAHEADSLYEKKEYLKAGETFGKAFAAFGDKGLSNDRYNAACSWALAGQRRFF